MLWHSPLAIPTQDRTGAAATIVGIDQCAGRDRCIDDDHDALRPRRVPGFGATPTSLSERACSIRSAASGASGPAPSAVERSRWTSARSSLLRPKAACLLSRPSRNAWSDCPRSRASLARLSRTSSGTSRMVTVDMPALCMQFAFNAKMQARSSGRSPTVMSGRGYELMPGVELAGRRLLWPSGNDQACAPNLSFRQVAIRQCAATMSLKPLSSSWAHIG